MLIKDCKYVVTQNKEREILEDVDILVKDSLIEKIERNIDSNEDVFDAKNKIVLPGLINAHTHLAMTLLRGYADSLPLDRWLKKIWPIEKKFTPEMVYSGALLGCLEMIKSGTTCFLDANFYMKKVEEAIKESGLRAVLGSFYSDFPTPESDEPFELAVDLVKNKESNELIKWTLAPHSPYLCSEGLLVKTREIADELGCGITIHAAETKQEVKEMLEKTGKTPVEYLNSIDFMDNDVLLAHCVWLNDNEIKMLEDLNVVHCPASNLKLYSGIMPWSKLKDKGVNISLGTDGAASNNNLDLFEEMKIASLIHKNDSDSQEILDAATINGAKALKLNTGSIEEDKLADLVFLDANQVHLTPLRKESLVSHLVYSVNGNDVTDVMVNGKLVMKNRKVLNVNEEEVLTDFEEKCRTLLNY